MADINTIGLSLIVPNAKHEKEYCRVMTKREAIEPNMQPELMRRYSKKLGATVSYSRWLEWCEDDRTTGSMLSTKVPCTLHFLVNSNNEILGSIVINHKNTRRGHLHAGIVPWHRGKGLGTSMLYLALERCNDMGLEQVHITPRKDNIGAIQTILRNGGIFLEELPCADTICSRYVINTVTI